jgi:hypothetical protein
VFSDEDHAGGVEKRGCTTGWVVMLYETGIAWGSKLQPVVADSTTAAEIIAASTAADEAVYCQKLLRDLGTPVEPTTLRVDNQAALKRVNNEMEDSLTRDVATHHMYVREKVADGEVKPEWIESKDNIAYLFTKLLGGRVFNRLRAMLGVTK